MRATSNRAIARAATERAGVATAAPRLFGVTIAGEPLRLCAKSRFWLVTMRDWEVGGLPADPGDWPADDRECLEERAAILEYDAGYPRGQAELLAEISVRVCREEVRE